MSEEKSIPVHCTLPEADLRERVAEIEDAISKKIVEAHDGTIDVVSEAGRGAEFVVNLPH